MSETSEMIRKTFKEGDDVRDAGLTAPENVMRYDDIVYGSNEKWQVLDVYRPKEKDGERLPVIVSVHGGAWVYGDKERYQYYCMSLAERGFAVVNFTYRLAPEYKFPAPLEDTNLVFTWLLAHAKEYGFDTEHIFGVGDSAGAHILGLYTAICTNPEYAENYDFKTPQGFAPTAIALNCGKYELTDTALDEQTRKLMEDFLPEGGSGKELELITVTNHVTKNYPPVFLMTAVEDFLKAQAPFMVEKLTACEVPFLYRVYGDKKNRLKHVFHCDMRLADAKLCNDEECNFFRSMLHIT